MIHICFIFSPDYYTSEIKCAFPLIPLDLLLSAALQGSSEAEGQIDGPALDSLGPLLPFLDQASLALVDRRALALRLEEMRGFCLPKEALGDIASLLIHDDLLG